MHITKSPVYRKKGEKHIYKNITRFHGFADEKAISGILENKNVTGITMKKRSKCETWLYLIITIITATIIYIQTIAIWILIILATTGFWLFYVLNRNTHKCRLTITFSSGKPLIIESRDMELLLRVKQMAMQTKINGQ